MQYIEGDRAMLNCSDEYNETIQITTVLYNYSTCSHGDKYGIQNLCDGHTTCNFDVTNSNVGSSCGADGKAALQVSYNCKRNGGWSHGTRNSSCSVTCGEGIQLYTRSCTNPSPNEIGTSCVGESYYQEVCNNNEKCVHLSIAYVNTVLNWTCPGGYIKVISATWQTPGEAGPFDVFTQMKNRCDNKASCGFTLNDANLGVSCDGNCSVLSFVYECVNVHWNSWEPWSKCSGSCVTGIQTRTRSCNSRIQAIQCEGLSTETKDCDETDCSHCGDQKFYDTQNSSSQLNTDSSAGSGYLLIDPVNTVHCCGQITMWYYIPVKTGTITFSVWRKTVVKRYKLVETNTVVVTGSDVNKQTTYNVPENERILINTGDIIGWHDGGHNIIGYYNCTHSKKSCPTTTLWNNMSSTNAGDEINIESLPQQSSRIYTMSYTSTVKGPPTFGMTPDSVTVGYRKSVNSRVMDVDITDFGDFIHKIELDYDNEYYYFDTRLRSILVKKMLPHSTGQNITRHNYVLSVQDWCYNTATLTVTLTEKNMVRGNQSIVSPCSTVICNNGECYYNDSGIAKCRDTTTVEPTTMPEESTTISPPPTTTMISTVKPCTNGGLNGTDMVLGQVCGQYGVDCRCTVSHSACMQSQNDTSWKCRCSQGYAKQNQQCVAITTTVEPTTTTVEPCTNGGLNRTDMVIGEVCGQYGVDGRCTVSHSACMQSKTDTSWKCRCSQGYAKQNQQCVAMPIKLFSSGQPVMVTVQESATSGFTIKSINFDEVSGFDVSNPTAEIKGPESSLFTVIASTTDVTLKLGRSLDRLNYVIFVTVSVTIDNVLIRDFVEVRISVSSQGVIGKNIVILHGTPKGSIIGQICTSCITGSDAISVSNSDVYGVNMEGSVATTKPINLDTLQSTMTIFNSTYILVYKNTNLIANVTIIVIRSQYTVTLDEGSVWNTQVALLKNIFHTFEIDTDGLGTSGDVINLGNITLDYEEQTEVTKTLSFSNPTGIMDTLYVLVTIKIQDVNDASPQFQQKPSNKPYNFLAVQSSYKNLIVGVVKAHDPDMSSMLTYNITPSDVLSINKQGVIKADQTIPRSNYTAMVTVSDGLFSDTVAIVVDLLLPTNTNLELNFTGTIDENTNAGAMITNVSVNGYKNYRLTDQAARNDLSLNSVTGLVKSVRPFNRENVQERQFKFTIVGNIENEVSCSLVIIGEITVNVIDVNDEPPVFINTPYTATVVEESSGEQLKMNLPMDTTDKDVNPTVSYSLVNHQDKFDINSLSGNIKTKVNISRETTPSLSISVKADDGVNSATAVIVVTIEDINDNPPYFTSTPYNFAVNESENENSQIGESVGTISANDNDIGKNAEITYQIHSDGGYFRINQTTGEITISRNLDREMNPTHKPIVYARDNGDNILSSSVTVTISVNDINDNAPLFSSDRIMVEFEENKDCSNIITNLTATDSDRPNSENSRITYSLLSGSDDFQIDPSTGSLRCQTMLNYENITSYTLLVKAQDNGSPAKLSSNKTVIINVKDINDNIPTFVDAKNSMIIRYFGIVQRVIEVLNVVDLDYGANGMVTFAISGSAAAFLTIDNKGILKTTASNKPSDGSYSLTITATDMGSPSTLTSSHSMNVTVSQHSKPPITFSRQEINMTIMENSNIGVEIGTISTEVNKPSGTTVTFEIIDEKADIKFSLNSDDGKVTLKGSIDREENEFHEFVVRVKNKTNDDQSDLALVTVQILDENDNKPIFDRENFYFEIREDSLSDTPTGVNVIATDADIGMNAEIKYTQLESGGCAAVFTFKENSIVLTGTIDYEVYTFCKLTVKAYNQNNETMSSTVNVHINVLDVNDNSPEFLQHTNNVYTVSVREDTTINTQIPAFGLLKDKDSRENGDIELSTESSCLFDVRRNYDKIQLQVKPSTTLDYESSINVYTCIIKAIDKGAPPLNATATLNISITDVNDNRPQITSPNTNVNVSRDAKVGHVIISQIHATDADSSENGELRYSLQNSQYYSKFIIDPATGRIAINSPLRFVQTDKIILMAIVSDKGIPPLSSAVVVTILITDDNPRPYLEQTPDINIQEHTQRPNDGEIVRVKAYDGVNANGVVKVCNCTFRLDTNRDDLKIDNDSGIVRFKNKDDSFDREKEYNSKVFVSVIASDRYDPPKDSDPMIITINILDINDQYPRFTQNIYHFKVYQKAPNGVQIGTVIAIDKDLAPDTRYSINITESSFSSSVVSINETTGEITKSGDMTLNQTSNTQIKGWVYAQDNKDLSKQPPDSKQITITIEFDDKNNHTPTFQLVQYNADMQWDAEVEQSIVQTMATDADSGVEGTISYSLVEGNSRGFFKIDNNGVLMLAYKLDSSIGTDATEIVTLTVKAMDGGIIPKYSSAQVIIRISGNNPGVCIQGTAHSKQVLDITEERNNWSYALYALVALLCIAIVCFLFFLYKWRTTISHPFQKDGKNKYYFSSGSDYNELGQRNTGQYSHFNEGFDPMSVLNLDPYLTVPGDDLSTNT